MWDHAFCKSSLLTGTHPYIYISQLWAGPPVQKDHWFLLLHKFHLQVTIHSHMDQVIEYPDSAEPKLEEWYASHANKLHSQMEEACWDPLHPVLPNRCIYYTLIYSWTSMILNIFTSDPQACQMPCHHMHLWIVYWLKTSLLDHLKICSWVLERSILRSHYLG